MPVAIITGASRGFGRALARSLTSEGWNLVIDARDPHALRASAEPLGVSGVVRAVPGDVADGAHRTALVAAAAELGGIDLLVNNASCSARRPSPRSPTTRSTCSRTSSRSTRSPRSHSHNWLSPGSANGTASSSTSPRTPRSSRTRVGAATDRRRPRSSSSATCSAPRSPRARLHVRPRRHAHADASRGVPGRGHLRSSRTRDGRARAPASPARRAPERPLPRRRLRDGEAMTAVVVREATEPPEARGITRDAVRMMVAHRADLRIVHARARSAPVPRRGRPRGGEHVGHVGRGARRAGRGRHPARRAPLATVAGRAVARRAAPPQRPRDGAVVRGPARPHAAARRRRTRPVGHALRIVGPLVGRDPRPRRAVAHLSRGARPARSATAT